MMADLILPDHTYLERWQDDQVTHLAGFTCFSVAWPAATPLYQTWNTADVVLQLAKGLGRSVAESFPWEEFEDLLYEAGRGYVVSIHPEESLKKILRRQGYWIPEFTSYDDFWAALFMRGAW